VVLLWKSVSRLTGRVLMTCNAGRLSPVASQVALVSCLQWCRWRCRLSVQRCRWRCRLFGSLEGGSALNRLAHFLQTTQVC